MGLIAFHGKKEIKDLYLQRVKEHRRLDEIQKGVYYEEKNGKKRMCAVGCTVHSGYHGAYETELGIPRIIARLEDDIFEGLPSELAVTWPERFLEAIPVGADLSLVWPRFAVWLLIDDTHGVLRLAKKDETKKAISEVAAAYQRVVDGVAIADINWSELRAAAYAAAYADAYASAAASAAAGAYAYAAYQAASVAAYAYAAAYADAYASAAASAYADASADAASAAAYADAVYTDAAAGAYADASAYNAAKKESRIAQSEKLIELLKSAPIGEKE